MCLSTLSQSVHTSHTTLVMSYNIKINSIQARLLEFANDFVVRIITDLSSPKVKSSWIQSCPGFV